MGLAHGVFRLATNPERYENRSGPKRAWQLVEEWLDAPAAWVPAPGPGHRDILGRLVGDLDLRANLVTDAVLAALCIEHGLQIVSADSDFARFDQITWLNPLGR